MKRNKLEIVNTALLALIIVLQIVIVLHLFDGSNKTAGTLNEGENDVSQEISNIDMVEIDTPYATLQYPSKWIEYLTCEETEDDNSYSMTFCCALNEQKVELFTFFFGVPEKGDLIDHVTRGSAQIPVTVESIKIEKDDWTQAEYEILSAMQDDVSVVINSFKKKTQLS